MTLTSTQAVQPELEFIDHTKPVSELLRDNDLALNAEQFYHFGQGNYCKLGAMSAEDFVDWFKTDQQLPEKKRMLHLHSNSNDSPCLGELLIFAQQCIDIQRQYLSDPNREVIRFGGDMHGAYLDARHIIFTTVYIRIPFADEGEVAYLKMCEVNHKLHEFSPDEDDPCDSFTEPLDEWHRLWWD